MDDRYFIKPTEEQEELLKKTVELGMRFFDGSLRESKCLVYKDPRFFFKKLNEPIPIDPVEVEKSLDILKEIGKYSISQFDINFLSFPDSGNSLPGMMGALFSKIINQNLMAFDRSAPIGTVIEVQLIEWLRQLMGYEYKSLEEMKNLHDVSGMSVTGGYMANTVAVMAALNNKFPEIKKKGLASLDVTPIILVSKKISHYSIDAAAHHLGIGRDNVVDIPTKSDFTTDYTKLKEVLDSLPEDKVPFMVVGVAGNTKTANLDNMEEIADFCEKNDLWLHVDACHGGSLLFSKKLKEKLMKGIERADSITIDPHKGLFITYPSSFVLFKRRDTLIMFTRYPEKASDEKVWDLGLITPFYGSRGFESLSFWMLIKIMGIKGIQEAVEYRSDLAKYAERLIEETGMFVKLNEMDFYRLAFVYCPKDVHDWLKENGEKLTKKQKEKITNLINEYDHRMNQKLYESGKLCLDEYGIHDVDNRASIHNMEDRLLAMAITVGNPLYTEESIKRALGMLFKEAEKNIESFKNDFKKALIDKSVSTQYDIIKGPAGW
ncbi:MAG: pyridoxal-dependent decarboxylase [archaeon]